MTRQSTTRSFLEDLLETIALALLMFLVLQVSVRNYRVELSSMEATLFPKDRLVVNKLVYTRLDAQTIDGLVPFVDIWNDGAELFPFHPPRRGDVIVFRFPQDPSRDFVKRVIALPGETIAMDRGRVIIDGEPLDEPYLEERDLSSLPPTLVPPRSYFVMGDNRDGSSDSRHWGMVPLENIVGKVLVRYWPPYDFSFMSAPSRASVDNPP